MRFTKDQLTAKGLRRRDVPIPDTDGVVAIRELTAAESKDFRETFRSLDPKDEAAQIATTSALIATALINDDGSRMFSDDEVPRLSGLLGEGTIAFIAGEVLKLAGTHSTEAAEDQKKDAGN